VGGCSIRGSLADGLGLSAHLQTAFAGSGRDCCGVCDTPECPSAMRKWTTAGTASCRLRVNQTHGLVHSLKVLPEVHRPGIPQRPPSASQRLPVSDTSRPSRRRLFVLRAQDTVPTDCASSRCAVSVCQLSQAIGFLQCDQYPASVRPCSHDDHSRLSELNAWIRAASRGVFKSWGSPPVGLGFQHCDSRAEVTHEDRRSRRADPRLG
jgi:hypothetical protein